MQPVSKSPRLLTVALLLASCGGGGGGGGEPPPTLAAITNAVRLSTFEDTSHSLTGTANFIVTNVPADGVFINASQTTTASKDGQLVLTGGNTFRIDIEFLPGSTLVPGIHKDTLAVHVCLDQQCAQEIAGSPQTVDFLFTVAPRSVGMFGQNELTADVLSIDALDLLWDAPRNHLYAATSSRSPLSSNSLVTLDPSTGAVLSAQFVGSDPDALALSDDGSFLYVGFGGANEFKRYALPEMTQDLAVRLPHNPNPVVGGPEKAIELDVAPGAPHTVAVSRGTLGFPRLGLARQSLGVTIYDDASPRPLTKELGIPRTASIQWGEDASTLYGGDSEGSALSRLSVDASGITSIEEIGLAGRIYYVDGLIYSDGGRVVNPQTGAFSLLLNGIVAVHSAHDRIFVLASSGLNEFELRSYGRSTRSLISSIILGGIEGDPRRFIHCGSDCLAISTNEKELVILRGPFVGGGPTPDSALFLNRQSISVSGGPPGAIDAPTARLHALTTVPLPEGTQFTFSNTNNGIADITTVEGPQQHTLRLNVTFKSPSELAPGKYLDTIEIHACIDPQCTQPLPGSPKIAHVLYTVASPRTVTEVGVYARELVYDVQEQLIYATTSPSSPTHPESLVTINPATGEFAVGLGTDKPNALAISANGQYLYAGLDAAGVVQRLQLPDLTPDLQIPFATEAPGPYRATRIAVAPDDPAVVAAVISDSNGADAVAILDEVGVRQNRVDFDDDTGAFDVVDALAWGANGSRLYGVGDRLNLLAVDANGVSVELRYGRESSPGGNSADRVQYVNGRLYGASGRVYDAETGDVLGTFPGRGQIVVDASLNRAFLADFGSSFGQPSAGTILEAYDLTTFLPAESLFLPCCSSFVLSAVRWGDDGLAIGRSSSGLVLINGPFVNQSPPP